MTAGREVSFPCHLKGEHEWQVTGPAGKKTYAITEGNLAATSTPSSRPPVAKLFHLCHDVINTSHRVTGDQIDERDERDVSDSGLVAYEPLPLGQDTLEDTEDTQDLVLVALLCGGDLLRVEECEPGGLTEVRALAGRLEEQPLQLDVLVCVGRSRDLVLRIVLVDEVDDNRVGLPELWVVASV